MYLYGFSADIAKNGMPPSEIRSCAVAVAFIWQVCGFYSLFRCCRLPPEHLMAELCNLL